MNLDNGLTNYLQDKNLSITTIDSIFSHLEYFDLWLGSQNIVDKINVSKGTILDYVKYLRTVKGVSVNTANCRLNSIKKYYDYLKNEELIFNNPVKNIVIRGVEKKVVQNVFSQDDLIELHANYCSYLDAIPLRRDKPNQLKTYHRNKLIVSLLIHQGLHTGELDKLTIADLNLKNGTIYIPSSRRSNGRVLILHSSQIIPFYEYLNEVPSTQEKLFDTNIQKGAMYRLLKQLKGINSILQNLQHIRASVLMNWIKIHGKRKSQYMIGHRFVSSTEGYELQDTTELSEMINKVHLFG